MLFFFCIGIDMVDKESCSVYPQTMIIHTTEKAVRLCDKKSHTNIGLIYSSQQAQGDPYTYRLESKLIYIQDVIVAIFRIMHFKCSLELMNTERIQTFRELCYTFRVHRRQQSLYSVAPTQWRSDGDGQCIITQNGLLGTRERVLTA